MSTFSLRSTSPHSDASYLSTVPRSDSKSPIRCAGLKDRMMHLPRALSRKFSGISAAEPALWPRGPRPMMISGPLGVAERNHRYYAERLAAREGALWAHRTLHRRTAPLAGLCGPAFFAPHDFNTLAQVYCEALRDLGTMHRLTDLLTNHVGAPLLAERDAWASTGFESALMACQNLMVDGHAALIVDKAPPQPVRCKELRWLVDTLNLSLAIAPEALDQALHTLSIWLPQADQDLLTTRCITLTGRSVFTALRPLYPLMQNIFQEPALLALLETRVAPLFEENLLHFLEASLTHKRPLIPFNDTDVVHAL